MEREENNIEEVNERRKMKNPLKIGKVSNVLKVVPKVIENLHTKKVLVLTKMDNMREVIFGANRMEKLANSLLTNGDEGDMTTEVVPYNEDLATIQKDLNSSKNAGMPKLVRKNNLRFVALALEQRSMALFIVSPYKLGTIFTKYYQISRMKPTGAISHSSYKHRTSVRKWNTLIPPHVLDRLGKIGAVATNKMHIFYDPADDPILAVRIKRSPFSGFLGREYYAGITEWN